MSLLSFIAANSSSQSDSPIWHIIFFLLGASLTGIGWIVEYWRRKSEINRNKAEAVRYAGESVVLLQAHRNKYRESIVGCRELATKLSKQIIEDKDIDTILETREEFCASLIEKSMPLYNDYIELEKTYISDNFQNLKALIENEIIPELRGFREWLEIINLPVKSKETHLHPAFVDKSKLTVLLNLKASLPKDMKDVGVFYGSEINKLLECGLELR